MPALTIAIVDDDSDYAAELAANVARACETRGLEARCRRFSDGASFSRQYRPEYSTIFMDIGMKQMDGLTCAAEIRRTDPDTPLIFVTQLAQYAIQGYKVNALDFLVKPVDYYSFELVFRRALQQYERIRPRSLLLNIKGKRVVLAQNDIYSVEVFRHYLTWHTVSGDYTLKGTLEEAAAQLNAAQFYQCHRCYLVNLARITSVGADGVQVGGQRIEVSRARREGLLQAVTGYLSGRSL